MDSAERTGGGDEELASASGVRARPFRALDNGTQRLVCEAARSSHSGELLLRCGEENGRVFILEGRIAWAYAEGRHRGLVDELVENHGLSRPQLSEVVRECQRSGRNFGEYLVERGALSPEALRSALQSHVSSQLRVIGRMAGLVTAVFIPKERHYAGRFTFAPEEILGETVADPVVHETVQKLERVRLEAMARFSEPLAVGVLDPRQRAYLLWTSNLVDDGTRARLELLVEQRTAKRSRHTGFTNDLSWNDAGEVAFEHVDPESGRRVLVVTRGLPIGLVLVRAQQVAGA